MLLVKELRRNWWIVFTVDPTIVFILKMLLLNVKPMEFYVKADS